MWTQISCLYHQASANPFLWRSSGKVESHSHAVDTKFVDFPILPHISDPIHLIVSIRIQLAPSLSLRYLDLTKIIQMCLAKVEPHSIKQYYCCWIWISNCLTCIGKVPTTINCTFCKKTCCDFSLCGSVSLFDQETGVSGGKAEQAGRVMQTM